MALHAFRRKGETVEAMMRRFSRRVQASGLSLEVKKYRIHTPVNNRLGRKKSALYRTQKTDTRKYLIRTGKLVQKAPARRGV